MRSHRFAALKRLVFVSGALVGSVASLAAQTPCPARDQVGWIGIDGIECTNCEFGRGYARFSTEPRIVTIAPGSPAVGVLRTGDYIVSVNGALITTEEGANRFTNLKPGQSPTFLIRREGQLIPARFTSIPGHCPGMGEDVRAAVAAGNAVRARGQGGVIAATPRPGSQGGALPTPSTPPEVTRLRPATRPGMVVGTPMAQAGGFASHVSRVIFGFGFSCNGCGMQVDRRNGEATMVWTFKSPPVLYSVETEGPAWRAGLRRGDVITQIDGTDITDDEAGRRFGAVQPGQTVRFTYRRDGDTRTASVTAVAPAGVIVAAPASGSSATESSLRRMRELLSEINLKEREEQSLVERLRGTEDESLRRALEKYRVDQVEQTRRLRELQAQLAVTEVRVRDATAAPGARAGIGRGGVASANSNTIRYSGHLGDTDIEIRGSRPVVVDESPDEIIIRTGDAEIRIRRRENR